MKNHDLWRHHLQYILKFNYTKGGVNLCYFTVRTPQSLCEDIFSVKGKELNKEEGSEQPLSLSLRSSASSLS